MPEAARRHIWLARTSAFPESSHFAGNLDAVLDCEESRSYMSDSWCELQGITYFFRRVFFFFFFGPFATGWVGSTLFFTFH